MHLAQQLGLHELLVVACGSLDVLRGQEPHARELVDNLLLLISHFVAQLLLVEEHHERVREVSTLLLGFDLL